MNDDESASSSPDNLSEHQLAQQQQHTFAVENLEQRMQHCTLKPMNWSSEDSDEHVVKLPDPNVIASLESDAQKISATIDVVLRDLRGSLHGMSDLTVESTQCFADAVAGTCESVDSVIKSTYAMLAKVEELNHSMSGLKQLRHQVTEIKRVVDLLETQLLIGSNA